MKPRVDTFQVGPAAPGLIGQLIEDKIPAVLEEARKSANGKNMSIGATYTKEGNETIAHIYIEYLDEELQEFNLVKLRTVVTEHWKCGVYNSLLLEEI